MAPTQGGHASGKPAASPPISECIDRLGKGFIKRDSHELREVMNHCAAKLITEEQHAYFLMALIAYILSKIAQKPRYRDPKVFRNIEVSLANSLAHAKLNNMTALNRSLDGLLAAITELEKVDRRFVTNVVEKGRTKIAALLYAQGISLNRALVLTGARKQEVLNYSGKTMMADRFGRTLPASERLKNARRILK
ncbi:Uncharacterised protein [uncultured archaeon]|nr:Uncharacterised protein [uncultured archaeon]